jgi:hypothetical protein
MTCSLKNSGTRALICMSTTRVTPLWLAHKYLRRDWLALAYTTRRVEKRRDLVNDFLHKATRQRISSRETRIKWKSESKHATANDAGALYTTPHTKACSITHPMGALTSDETSFSRVGDALRDRSVPRALIGRLRFALLRPCKECRHVCADVVA